ncbi:MAG: hypothetical protein M2R45_02457 [Verrucomicrobia subdivision 3 bacterium]|nr:hypothetical protein [Limisphaerales bacterium]MCS1413246.1 hypothetical protein [Limisphaerales bacterium]
MVFIEHWRSFRGGHSGRLWDLSSGEQGAILRGAREEQRAVAKENRLVGLLEGASELAKKETVSIAEELEQETERVSKAEKALTKFEEAKNARQAAKDKAKQLENQVVEAKQAFETAKLESATAAKEAKALVTELREAQKAAEVTELQIKAIDQKLDEALKRVAD